MFSRSGLRLKRVLPRRSLGCLNYISGFLNSFPLLTLHFNLRLDWGWSWCRKNIHLSDIFRSHWRRRLRHRRLFWEDCMPWHWSRLFSCLVWYYARKLIYGFLNFGCSTYLSSDFGITLPFLLFLNLPFFLGFHLSGATFIVCGIL